MGKARRKLQAARKEILEEERGKNIKDNIPIIIDDYDKIDPVFDTAFDIQRALFKFTDDNSFPLCEYLHIDSICNFIHWLKRFN